MTIIWLLFTKYFSIGIKISCDNVYCKILYTMHIKKCVQKNLKCVQLKMLFIIKFGVNAIKKLFGLTLYQVIWICGMLLCFCIMFWTYKFNYSITTKLKKTEHPVILWWTEGFPGTSEIKNCPGNIKCEIYSQKNISEKKDVNAYLFYGSNIHFEDLPLPRRPREIIWGLYHEESPRNVEELMHENILKLFNYSATLSRYSDVPFPLQYLKSFEDITNKEFFVETKVKNSLLNEIAPVLYLQSDCETSTERDAYVKELMKFIKIDSYGNCLNNKKLPSRFTEDYINHLNDDEFLKFIARYKFVIAIENGVCDDYFTEKFWRAIIVGSVPIYFGSPSIIDWLPNVKSAILLKDYPTPKILSEHLQKLLGNDKLYEDYLDHKTLQVVSNKRLVDEFRTRPNQIDSLATSENFECLICKKLHERKQGVREERVIDKSHYNCPKPVSALTLAVNPENHWVYSWRLAEVKADKIYKKVMNNQ